MPGVGVEYNEVHLPAASPTARAGVCRTEPTSLSSILFTVGAILGIWVEFQLRQSV